MTIYNKKLLVYLFLFFFSVALVFHSGHLFPQDDEIRFRIIRSILHNHSLAIQPVRGFGTKKGIDGKEYPQYGIGQSIFSIPLYILGEITYKFLPHQLDNVYRKNTMRFHPDNLKEFWLRHCVSLYNSFIFSFIGIFLFLIYLHLSGNLRKSLLYTIFILLSTMLFAYSRTYFSEPSVALCFLIIFYLLLKNTNTYKSYLIIGLVSGLCFFIRQDSLVGIFILTVILFYRTIKNHIKWHFFILYLTIVIFSGFIVLYLNYSHFGNPFYTGYEDQSEGISFSAPLLVSFYGFIFSIGKGLFFYSPPLLLSLWCIKKLEKKIPFFLFLWWSTIIICYFIFYSSWQNWAGGWDWGPRHIFILVPFLAIPFIFWTNNSLGKKIAFFTLIILGIFVQILANLCSINDYYTYFLMLFKGYNKSQFYHSIYVPDSSPFCGYIWLIKNHYLDLWWINLLKSNMNLWWKCLPFINIIIVFTSLFIILGYVKKKDV